VQVSRVDLDARKIDLRLVTEPGIKTVLKNEAKRADSEGQARERKSRTRTEAALLMAPKEAPEVPAVGRGRGPKAVVKEAKPVKEARSTKGASRTGGKTTPASRTANTQRGHAKPPKRKH